MNDTDKLTQKRKRLFSLLLYGIPMGSCAVYLLLCRTGIRGIAAGELFTLFACALYDGLRRLQKTELSADGKGEAAFWTAYVLSFVFLAAGAVFPVGFLWLLLVVTAALWRADAVFACMQGVYLLLQACICRAAAQGFDTAAGYETALSFLMAGLFAVLFAQLQQRAELPYLAVILLACDGSLQFAAHRFQLQAVRADAYRIAAELISILLFVAAAWMGMRTSENRQNELQRQLQRLTEPDGALLSKMEAYSAALLQHSVEISHLSENAAKQIGADAALACAGGLYHELGRIAGTEDYIQAGVQLGQENEFPEALLDVIRQHSTGHDLPKSPEAAVVMLSDCIVSTQEYLKKTGKLAEISPKRLIEGIFQNRIKKGNLAHAGLTAEQLDDLQEFYIQQALAKTQ